MTAIKEEIGNRRGSSFIVPNNCGNCCILRIAVDEQHRNVRRPAFHRELRRKTYRQKNNCIYFIL